jgi:hypothetical protein
MWVYYLSNQLSMLNFVDDHGSAQPHCNIFHAVLHWNWYLGPGPVDSFPYGCEEWIHEVHIHFDCGDNQRQLVNL